MIFFTWDITGDFDPGLAKEFAYEFTAPYSGCKTHFGMNVRKNGDNKSYKIDVYQKEWEHSLRNITCLPHDEIMGKVTLLHFLVCFHFCVVVVFGKTQKSIQ